MTINEVANQSVRAVTYEDIRHDVIFGKLKAGSRLKLGILKEQYSASISTLREVLSRLANEGFIEAKEQKGFFVPELSQANLEELIDLRYLLESYMLQISFNMGDIKWESEIIAAHHRLNRLEIALLSINNTKQEDIHGNWKVADFEFHNALISRCTSVELTSIHKIVFDKYLRYQMNSLVFRGETSIKEHKDLLDAALSKDLEKAQSVLKVHIQGSIFKTS